MGVEHAVKRSRSNRLDRACELRLALDKQIFNFDGEIRLHTDGATSALMLALAREFRRGYAKGRAAVRQEMRR